MPGIGSTLREARIRAHLEIADFEMRSKIRAKYLRALEDEEWGLLPGYTFTKGFLRTYADMLGLDGRALVDEFRRQYRDPSDPELPALPSARRDARRQRDHGNERGTRMRPPRPPPGRGGRPIVVAVVVLVVLLAGALYAIGVLLPRGGHSTTTTTTTTATTHKHTGTVPAGTHAPTVVALKLEPTAPVYVCLVGYPSASSRHPHVRINAQTVVPGGHEPVYHDDHFRLTLGNGALTMVVDNHRHRLGGSDPRSYKISRAGTISRISSSAVPQCG